MISTKASFPPPQPLKFLFWEANKKILLQRLKKHNHQVKQAQGT